MFLLGGFMLAAAGASATSWSPWIRSFDVGISGVMPAEVIHVQVGDQVVSPRDGAYTVQVLVPVGIRHAVVLVRGLGADGTVMVSREVAIDLKDLPVTGN